MDAINFQQMKSPGDISVDDRRQYIARIQAEIEMSLTTPDFKGAALSIDVSVAGLQVQSRIQLKLEDRVIISVRQADEAMHVCALVARVAPCDDPSTGNKYGLRILSEDIPRWQGVLRRLML